MMFHDMSTLAFISNLRGPDLIVILVIILVLFGAKRLPELARGMGQAVKEFNKGKDEPGDELTGTSQAEIAAAPAKSAHNAAAQDG